VVGENVKNERMNDMCHPLWASETLNSKKYILKFNKICMFRIRRKTCRRNTPNISRSSYLIAAVIICNGMERILVNSF
jgi:hypothetical protein